MPCSSFLRRLTVALAGAGFLALAAPASAGSISYTGYTVLNEQNVHITDTALGINNEYGGAGLITLTGTNTPGGSLQVFCVDVADYLQGNGTFGTGMLSGTFANNVNALLTNGLPLLGGNYNASAALQVAIWQMEYGAAITITPDNSAVGTLASTYVSNVSNGVWLPNNALSTATLLGYGSNQNQAYLVPEPASLAVLAAGLVLIGRRRRAA